MHYICTCEGKRHIVLVIKTTKTIEIDEVLKWELNG